MLCVVSVMHYCAFVTSERAYLVMPSDIRLGTDATSIKESTHFVLIMKNIGKHVASVRSFNVKISPLVNKKTFPEAPDYSDAVIQTTAPTPPGGENMVHLTPFYSPINMPVTNVELLKQINSGEVPLYIYGFVDYDTGYFSFGSGKTGFCFKYIPEQNRPNPTIIFQICENQKYTYVR